MANAPQNLYKADLRDVMFVLFEQFKLGELLGKEPYEGWGDEEVRMVISECYRFCCEVLGPVNALGDAEGCRIEDGQAKVPSCYKAAHAQLYEAGWKSVGVSPHFDGQGAPKAVFMAVEEFITGANTSLSMYPGLAHGTAELIEEFGTDEQKEKYCHKVFHGVWGGTMCLTEPEAGSDVGAARSKAFKNPDGTYRIEGTKLFISSGDSDMVENVIHLVLARIEGAAPGTKGLSLFIVPKYRINPDGSSGEPNDVVLAGLEHKMGIKGSTTALLNFGENGKCIGELVGGIEHEGMKQMFKMMNGARIFVGIQGLANASSAYLNALTFCRDRKQGSSIENFKDPTAPRVTIINHPDVRRMLLDMKSRVEGIRALAIKLSMHQDFAQVATDEKKKAHHQGQVDVLTPIVKAYGTDEAYRVCVTAMQAMGGAGYISDYGVEQYCRDSRIFTIYEGTNHIQAMDLVGRKLGQRGGANFQGLIGDIAKFVAKNGSHPRLGTAVKLLSKAQEAVAGGAMLMFMWSQSGKLKLVDLHANRFLEMMGATTVAWLLLDAALIAEEALQNVQDGHPDRNFYEGKIQTALFFARNNLPLVPTMSAMMQAEDDSALVIPEEGFATI
jgi:alkylation response protein AidB-like acyl-CoA dehydrogenase